VAVCIVLRTLGALFAPARRESALTEDVKVPWLRIEGGRAPKLFTNTGGDMVWRVRDDALPEL
jgi:hypothetical protein